MSDIEEPIEYPAGLSMMLEGDDLSMLVTWKDDTNHDNLVDVLVLLTSGKIVEMVAASIKAFGQVSDDQDFADILAERYLEKMAEFGLKSNKPVVPPRAAVPMLMARGGGVE